MKKSKIITLLAVCLSVSLIGTTSFTEPVEVYAKTYVSQGSKLKESNLQKKTITKEKKVYNAKHADGVKPLTKKDKQWLKENAIDTKAVALNKIGLKRTNEARAKKGLKPIASSKAVKVGDEVILGNSAATGKSENNRYFAQSANTAGIASTDISNLPETVDNSELPYFPAIGNQFGGSCASFSTTYYQATYMNAMAHDWNIKDNQDDSKIFSTKWTYNFINMGKNAGSWQSDAYKLFKEQGIATQKDIPYVKTDSTSENYFEWPKNPDIWKNAAKNRLDKMGTINIGNGSDNPVTFSEDGRAKGLDQVKQLLNDGYILCCNVPIEHMCGGQARDNVNSKNDDKYIGENVVYAGFGNDPHGVNIVGYNDDIWVDMNKDGIMEPEEKGAFKMANSWGDDSSNSNRGFQWISYDALNKVSSLQKAPVYSSSCEGFARDNFFMWNELYWITMKTSTPKLLVQVDINTAHRNQLKFQLGYSDDNGSEITWKPEILNSNTGDYSFDGTTTASDGTVVLDYSNFVPYNLGSTKRKWYLQVTDGSKSAMINGFKFIDPSASIQDLDPSSFNYQVDGAAVDLTDYKLASRKTIGDSSNPTVISMDYGLKPNSQDTPTDNKNRVGVPRFSVPSGAYEENQKVSITSSTPDAVIHYTTDGTDPTENSPVYNEPIIINRKMTIKAIAVKEEYCSSYVVSANYNVGTKIDLPTFNIPSGTYKYKQKVEIKSLIPDAVIHYTTNGAVPTKSSPVYTGAVTLYGKMTLKAIVTKSGYADSDVTSADYTAPYIIGDVNVDGTVDLRDVILIGRYSRGLITKFPNVDNDMWVGDVNGDGKIDNTDFSLIKNYAAGYLDCFPKEQQPSVPTQLIVTSTTSKSITLSWTASTGAVDIDHYEIYRDGTLINTSTTNSFTDSTVAEHTKYSYTVMAVGTNEKKSISSSAVQASTDGGQVELAKLSISSGTYKYMQKVSITCDTPNSVIKYTTDGTDPTTVSATYMGPITLHDNMTVKAIAIRDGYVNSPITSASYTAPSFVGDVNGDGKINVIDAILIQRYASGKITDFPNIDDDMWAGDLNGDGKIDSTDISLVKSYLRNNINYFPKEQPTAPDGLKVDSTAYEDITLSWTASSAVGAGTIDHYEIYRNGVLLPQIAKNNTFTDSTVNECAKYSYTIVAVDTNGRKSVASSALQAYTDKPRQQD